MQGGRVQLEQSDMRMDLNMVKQAKGRFSRAIIEETEYLIKTPRRDVRVVKKKQGVEFLGHTKVQAVIARQPAMLRQIHKDGCLPCHNGTTKNPQTHWGRKGTGAPPLDRHRRLTPQPTPCLPGSLPLPGTSPAPPGNNARAQWSQIINLPAGHVYSHTSPPCTEFFTPDAYAQDSQHDTDFDPHMLPDEGTSTGLYSICCVVMQLTTILKSKAANWANLQVMTSFDRKERDFEVYYYLQLADTVKYILQDLSIWIVKEHCIDQGESKWTCEKGCQNNVNDILSTINWLRNADTPVAKPASTECHYF